jgi:hypothetical protein
VAYQVDDSFDTWPEVIRVGTAAAGLYLRCGAYIARNLTDGHVPLEVATMYGTREWCSKLVEAGLWEADEAGYRDVYYLATKDGAKLNPTRAEALVRKEAARDRTRRWREGRKRGNRAQPPAPEPPKHGDASQHTSRDANVRVTPRVGDPSRDASLSFPPSKEGKGNARPAAPGAARVPPTPTAIRIDGGHPYDRTALTAQLSAARTAHRARANGRTPQGGLAALSDAVLRIAPQPAQMAGEPDAAAPPDAGPPAIEEASP